MLLPGRPPANGSHALLRLLPAAAVAAAAAVTTLAALPATFVYNRLISEHGKFGRIADARETFDQIPQRNIVSYNAMIAAYARAGYIDECFVLLSEMMLSGLRPTESTVGGILAARPAELRHALRLHPLILKAGLLHGGAFTGTALLGALGRSGEIGAAAELFKEMGSRRSTVTWNSMITELSRNGMEKEALELFMELRRTELKISDSSLVLVLSAVEESLDVEQIHSLAVKSGMDSRISVGNSLLSSYCKNSDGGRVGEKLLWSMPVRDVASWNAMVSGLCKLGEPIQALRHVSLMGSADGFLPNGRTLASALCAVLDLEAPPVGESIHGKAVVLGLEEDEFVITALVNFYAKCGRMNKACYLFEEMPARRVPTWNALLSGFSRRELAGHCLAAVREMLRSGGAATPNELSFSSALRSSSSISELRQLHSLIVKLGFDRHGRVASAAASAYAAADESFDPSTFLLSSSSSSQVLPVALANALGGIWNRRGHYRETMELINRVEEPDLISCNILLVACARSGDHGGALRMFKQILAACGSPDDHAAVSFLNVCKNRSDLRSGALIHGVMIKTGFLSFDVFAHNALLEMYAKCGSLEGSRKVFDEMPERNLVSWTVMISALGIHGGSTGAVATFRRMEEDGFSPDGVAFLAVLSACRHGGLLEEGMKLLKRMEEGDDAPSPAAEHYACVVELFCKSGRIKDAERVISSMPFPPGAAIWRIFLRGCADLAGVVQDR